MSSVLFIGGAVSIGGGFFLTALTDCIGWCNGFLSFDFTKFAFCCSSIFHFLSYDYWKWNIRNQFHYSWKICTFSNRLLQNNSRQSIFSLASVGFFVDLFLHLWIDSHHVNFVSYTIVFVRLFYFSRFDDYIPRHIAGICHVNIVVHFSFNILRTKLKLFRFKNKNKNRRWKRTFCTNINYIREWILKKIIRRNELAAWQSFEFLPPSCLIEFLTKIYITDIVHKIRLPHKCELNFIVNNDNCRFNWNGILYFLSFWMCLFLYRYFRKFNNDRFNEQAFLVCHYAFCLCAYEIACVFFSAISKYMLVLYWIRCCDSHVIPYFSLSLSLLRIFFLVDCCWIMSIWLSAK